MTAPRSESPVRRAAFRGVSVVTVQASAKRRVFFTLLALAFPTESFVAGG
jgi:hypothetical protein